METLAFVHEKLLTPLPKLLGAEPEQMLQGLLNDEMGTKQVWVMVDALQ